jgi:hypothetical protein
MKILILLKSIRTLFFRFTKKTDSKLNYENVKFINKEVEEEDDNIYRTHL